MNVPDVETTAGLDAPGPTDSWTTDASDLSFSELVTLTAAVFVGVTLVLIVVFQLSKPTSANDGDGEHDLRQRVFREEMPLGEFKCMTSTPSADSQHTLQVVEFEATAVVRGTGYELLEMGDRLRYYSARIGQQLDHAARSASAEELADPSLTLLRQRMRGRVNAIFGADLVHEVIFGRFRMYGIANPGVLSD